MDKDTPLRLIHSAYQPLRRTTGNLYRTNQAQASLSVCLTHGNTGRDDMAASGVLSANHPLSSRCSTGRAAEGTDVDG